MRHFLVLFSLFYLSCFQSQENWDFDKKENKVKLFLDTRGVNGHTVNTLEKKSIRFSNYP